MAEINQIAERLRAEFNPVFAQGGHRRAHAASFNRSACRARNRGKHLSVVSQLKLLLPPKAEQDAIVEFLDEQTRRTQKIEAKSRDQVDKIREYRSALITAAVTGQLDIPAHEKKREALA